MALTPKALLEHLGIPFRERVNRLSLCCPFHADTNPSAGFYEDSGKFFCYTCSLSLDMVGFYAKIHGTNWARATVELEQTFGPIPPREQDTRKLEVEHARGLGGRTLDQLLPVAGLKKTVAKEEQLEKLLWEYENGAVSKPAFQAQLKQWLGQEDQGPLPEAQLD